MPSLSGLSGTACSTSCMASMLIFVATSDPSSICPLPPSPVANLFWTIWRFYDELNRGELKAWPPDADTSFVPAAWRGSLQSNEPRRRRTWEFPWPSLSKMLCAVAMCFCPPLAGMSRFGISAMTSPPGNKSGRRRSIPWVCQPMVQPPSRPWSKSFTTPRRRPNATGPPIRLSALRVDVYVYARLSHKNFTRLSNASNLLGQSAKSSSAS